MHACLYFISPHGRGLSLLDLETLAQLADTVNIIPLIARADTLTRAELSSFKLKVDVILGHLKGGWMESACRCGPS